MPSPRPTLDAGFTPPLHGPSDDPVRLMQPLTHRERVAIDALVSLPLSLKRPLESADVTPQPGVRRQRLAIRPTPVESAAGPASSSAPQMAAKRGDLASCSLDDWVALFHDHCAQAIESVPPEFGTVVSSLRKGIPWNAVFKPGLEATWPTKVSLREVLRIRINSDPAAFGDRTPKDIDGVGLGRAMALLGTLLQDGQLPLRIEELCALPEQCCQPLFDHGRVTTAPSSRQHILGKFIDFVKSELGRANPAARYGPTLVRREPQLTQHRRAAYRSRYPEHQALAEKIIPNEADVDKHAARTLRVIFQFEFSSSAFDRPAIPEIVAATKPDSGSGKGPQHWAWDARELGLSRLRALNGKELSEGQRRAVSSLVSTEVSLQTGVDLGGVRGNPPTAFNSAEVGEMMAAFSKTVGATVLSTPKRVIRVVESAYPNSANAPRALMEHFLPRGDRPPGEEGLARDQLWAERTQQLFHAVVSDPDRPDAFSPEASARRATELGLRRIIGFAGPHWWPQSMRKPPGA